MRSIASQMVRCCCKVLSTSSPIFSIQCSSLTTIAGFDNVPSHLIPQLQACAARYGYVDQSFTQSGPSSSSNSITMPNIPKQSNSSIERRHVGPVDSEVPLPPNQDPETWPAATQSYGAPVLEETGSRDRRSTQQTTSQSPDCSSPEVTMEAMAEAPQRQPRKHWSSAQRRRVPHHLIERRYRDNLNGQIDKLRTCIPSLANEGCSSTSDMEDDPTPVKCPSKAAVIVSAQAYIKDLEEQQTRLQSHARALQEQVSGLQKLVRCDDCSVVKYFNSLRLNGSLPDQ